MGRTKMPLLLVPAALFLLSQIVDAVETRPAPVPAPSPTAAPSGQHYHYVLVHGPILGAWCWYKVVKLLRSAGNHVTALDLSGCGINSENYNDIQSVSDYFRPLTDYMASLPPHEKVVLVAHSFGGIATAYMMEHFSEKISVSVFIAGLMPGLNYNASAVYVEARSAEARVQQELDNRIIHRNGTNANIVAFGPKFLKRYVFQFAPIEDYQLALLLLRPQRVQTPEDISNVVVLTPKRFGTVPRVFIINEFDQTVPTSFQRSTVERNPPDEVLQINGTDHVVMFTKPVELVNALCGIAARYSKIRE